MIGRPTPAPPRAKMRATICVPPDPDGAQQAPHHMDDATIQLNEGSLIVSGADGLYTYAPGEWLRAFSVPQNG